MRLYKAYWYIFSHLLLLCPAFLHAESAQYSINLKVQENTYTQNHTLNYSQLMFNNLTVTAQDELLRKTILLGNTSLLQQQGRVSLNLRYKMNEKLSIGGRMIESINHNGLRTGGNNSYNFEASYAPHDSAHIQQTLGSVSEERKNIRDWGIKYTTNVRYRLSETNDADIFFRGNYAGDNLKWGRTIMGGGGTFFKAYQPGNTVKMMYDYSQQTKRDEASELAGNNSYAIISHDHTARLNIAYTAGSVLFDIGGVFRQHGVNTQDNPLYAQSIDYNEQNIALNLSMHDLVVAMFSFRGGLHITDKKSSYPDISRNEVLNSLALNGALMVQEGLFEQLRIRGNYKKSILKDEDEEDDRDDINIIGAISMPLNTLGAVSCSLESDIVMNKTVYMHKSRSQNSRWNKLYRIGPRLGYALTPWLHLNQKYILSARYIENIIKDYYGDKGISQVDALRDRITREFTLGNNLTASLATGITFLLNYNYSLEEKSQFEGGLFESVFRRMPTGLKGKHAYRLSFTLRPMQRLTIAPVYEYNYWHEDALVYDPSAERVSVEDSRAYRKHSAQFMVRYSFGKVSTNLNTVYIFKKLDEIYEEKKYIQFSVQIPLL